jgi:DNA adenine methylase
MTNDQHAELAEVLSLVRGKVAISNYDCDLMKKLYPSKRWKKFVSPERTIHSTKGKRSEVLWTNYDPEDLTRTLKLSLFEV